MVALRKTSKTSPSSNIPLISTILFIQWAHYIILGLFFHQIHRNHGSPVFNPSVAQCKFNETNSYIKLIIKSNN